MIKNQKIKMNKIGEKNSIENKSFVNCKFIISGQRKNITFFIKCKLENCSFISRTKKKSKQIYFVNSILNKVVFKYIYLNTLYFDRSELTNVEYKNCNIEYLYLFYLSSQPRIKMKNTKTSIYTNNKELKFYISFSDISFYLFEVFYEVEKNFVNSYIKNSEIRFFNGFFSADIPTNKNKDNIKFLPKELKSFSKKGCLYNDKNKEHKIVFFKTVIINSDIQFIDQILHFSYCILKDLKMEIKKAIYISNTFLINIEKDIYQNTDTSLYVKGIFNFMRNLFLSSILTIFREENPNLFIIIDKEIHVEISLFFIYTNKFFDFKKTPLFVIKNKTKSYFSVKIYDMKIEKMITENLDTILIYNSTIENLFVIKRRNNHRRKEYMIIENSLIGYIDISNDSIERFEFINSKISLLNIKNTKIENFIIRKSTITSLSSENIKIENINKIENGRILLPDENFIEETKKSMEGEG